MELILITKPECEKCEYVKGKIPDGMDITILDGTEPEGMSFLALAERLDAHMPILIFNDGSLDPETVEGSIRIKQAIHEQWQSQGNENGKSGQMSENSIQHHPDVPETEAAS